MRLLIIDNNIDQDSWGSPDLRRLALLAEGATIYVRRAPHDDLPAHPKTFDRIIVSGSKTSALEEAPWISNLHRFIHQALDEGKPFLGVCYGHQSLVRALGGTSSVGKSEKPEFGWSKIEITQDTPLTQGLSNTFYTFSSHYEEVKALPAGMKRLARSEDCEIQACHLEGRPVFGIQFHPEKDLTGAQKTIAERVKKKDPKKLLHPTESEKLYDPKVGEIIFKNFFKL